MTTTAAQAEFNELIRDKDTHHSHPEDRLDDSDHSDAESSHAADFLERTDTDDELDLPTDMRSNYYLPSIRSEANTGPKGVIADAHAFEQAKKQAQKQARRFSKRSPPSSYHATAYHDDKSEDDSEDSFMKKWRESRLRDLENVGQRIRSRTTSPSKKIYGDLPAVDALGFLNATEHMSRDLVVVVLIYDDRSDTSATVETYMREVAQRNNTIRFIKLHCEDADMGLVDADLPAVLIYKRNALFASYLPVTAALPKDSELSAISLETGFRG
ncbi:hypothetical protein K505DRAFT_359048 [Melanomma pulvis-pyrius CBS 109.77]|uniref:Phosducin domain-containing protein n=1 Tax=Melanomma pulvis-pyrius CBS 109.77 TaxID=1314802 RepID=A0A6A6XJQ9_9PLEO|nr:hypothetical protein K505DRAFT_359048 [Melanomma pulvis-pyrius CBS 109.77]